MPDFRRGAAAIAQAQESNKGQRGDFSPFAPNIQWRADKEEKYILFINRAEDIPTLALHEWIEVGTYASGKPRYESFLSRRDPALDEGYDDIEDRLGQEARLRTLAVAVELEPTFAEVKGRKRPTGFRVKTESFERKSEDGTEEVTAPIVGFVVQSPLNFFGWVGSFNEQTAPIEETPLHIVRRGKDANTNYDITPYLDQPVDFTPLFDYLDGVRYLNGEVEDLKKRVDTLEPLDAALTIGGALLEKRLEELADKERYEQHVGPLEELPDRFGKKKDAPAPKERAARPARPTQAEAASSPRREKFARLRQEVEQQRAA